MAGEFYIGYRKEAPRSLARFIRVTALVIVGIAIAVGGVSGWFQLPGGDGIFEYGEYRDFEGVMYDDPFPYLRVNSLDEFPAGLAGAMPVVASGKFGMPAWAADGVDNRVRFRGTLIYRGGAAMVEMNDRKSFEVLGAPEMPRPVAETTGRVTLEGELVDTKCFLGVMKPGSGKVHRGCAVVCLRGGVPPGLFLRRQDGSATVVFLAGRDGALDFDPEWAGRRVRVTGDLEGRDGMTLLRTRALQLADLP